MSPGEAYFDIDGDELRASATEDTETRLTWRGDPMETGSDCAIIVVTNELQTVTYHVHKCVMCFGSRQSKYFANVILQSRSTNEVQKIPSFKIELDQTDAENFPIFLDFVYERGNTPSVQIKSILSNGTMDTAIASCFSSPSLMSAPTENDTFTLGDEIATENAVSLRHLARKFENDALMRAVNKFIQKDLNFQTGPVYLYKAWESNDDRLMESAQRLCVENIGQVDVKALIRLPITLFRIVIKSLESFEEENEELSLLLSEVVCRYMEKHPDARTAELVLELTDPLLMPYIASEAAIGYTAIVKDLEPDDAAHHWTSLVRLCKRCAKAVVREYGWSDFSVNAAVNEYLGHQHPKRSSLDRSAKHTPTRVDGLLFATSFAAALEQAQDDYEDITVAHDQLESMVSSLNESLTKMEHAHQRKDQYIEKLQRKSESAEQEIVELRRQLQDIRKQQSLPRPAQRLYSPPMPPMVRQRPLSYGGEEHVSHFQTSDFHQSAADERNRQQQPRPLQQQHQPGEFSSPPPMARQRMQQQQMYDKTYDEQPPDLLEMNFPQHKDLISPAQVGMDVHANKNRKRQELRTKSEMRSKSLLI